MSVDYRQSTYPLQSTAPGTGAHHETYDRLPSEQPDPDLFADVRAAIDREDQQTDLEELLQISEDAEQEMPRVIKAFARILSQLSADAKLSERMRATLDWSAKREDPGILSLAARITAGNAAEFHDTLANHRRARLLRAAGNSLPSPPR